ncbi:MAG: GNAT family N-acetyltransferase [Frankia sp.]
MTKVQTARLSLYAVDAAEARRIHERAPDGDDAWAPDYPFDGDLSALGGFLRASEQHGEQRPFGYYRLTRQSDSLAIGGIGFIGPPAAGVVEVGYGLVPSARGHGYAAEALTALLMIARDNGVTRVRADTDPDNIASQKTLTRVGFEPVARDSDLHHFEIGL